MNWKLPSPSIIFYMEPHQQIEMGASEKDFILNFQICIEGEGG